MDSLASLLPVTSPFCVFMYVHTVHLILTHATHRIYCDLSDSDNHSYHTEIVTRDQAPKSLSYLYHSPHLVSITRIGATVRLHM